MKLKEFLHRIQNLVQPSESAELGTEATKWILEVGLAFGWLSGLAVVPIGVAGLSGIALVIKVLKLYREKKGQELTLAEVVAIALPLAYIESLNELALRNKLLKAIGNQTLTEVVQQQVTQLNEWELDEELAKDALRCFHKSAFAQVLNPLLLVQLPLVGIDAPAAQILTAWVAKGTQKYIQPALGAAEDPITKLAATYSREKQSEPDQYDSIEIYLQSIAAKPKERVFKESFSFQDVYVPLKARRVDSKGEVDRKGEPLEIESWATRMLSDPEKSGQVMFIQGGPGRGKSVFCRMFADWVRENLHPVWTPILIRLRDIENFQLSLEETLRTAVKTDFTKNDPGWLTDRNTRFLFLLDGFDELRMEGRKSGGLEKFLTQVGNFGRDCHQSSEMGHKVLITGRSLALQGIEKYIPENLEKVELQPMDNELQQQWLTKWAKQVGEDKKSAFQKFLQDQSCPRKVKEELAREPLLLYLLAAMHRDNKLSVAMFQDASGIQAKILIYEQSLEWVLAEQRPKWLNRELTGQETTGLRRILAEAGLCVVQSGGECAPVQAIEERLESDDAAVKLLKQARERQGENALKNALAAFYLQPAAGDKGGAVEFAHKSFGEFLCAERLKKSLEDWTRPEIKQQEFCISTEEMNWQIYDLLGYGGLTPEIVEYLMALLAGNKKEFRPMQLFKRLENFYWRWCEGEFIDADSETLPQQKVKLFKKQLFAQDIPLGQRQVDIYTGLNVLIILLELHWYAQSQDDLKQQIIFHPCGQAETDNFDPERLLRIMGYSGCIGAGAFLKIVGWFLSGANLSAADLSNANLSRANLSRANLSGADLSNANLSDANLISADLSAAYLISADLSAAYLISADLSAAYLSGANLSGADLSAADLSRADLSAANLENIIWNQNTKWQGVQGLETAINVPEGLKKLIS